MLPENSVSLKTNHATIPTCSKKDLTAGNIKAFIFVCSK